MKISRSFEKTLTSSMDIERWRYPRFFSDSTDDERGTVFISGSDAAHISKVLRMKKGDLAVVCDGKGTDRLCSVLSADKDCVELKIEDERACEAEPDVYLRLFQSVPKSNKLDFIVQKAVELGAGEIIPVMSARCVSRPDESASAKKTVRLQRIADEAAKQCGRGILPRVCEGVSFEDAVKEAGEDAVKILFYECGGKSLGEIISSAGEVKKLDIFIGPEGGYEKQEVRLAEDAGFCIAGLGKRILRCETAPVAAISILMNLTENM